ncbi:MAG: HIT domain-containing protein [Deltaproteobacteria bacterium]|jgi:histidine triad (HIT) family protein|nr:HIT domain-containing protein [Deltaproteobacteria bacterium]
MPNCIFCEIVGGRIPSIRVYEDESFIALMDINPLTQGHLLIITRQHYATTLDVPDDILAKALPLARRLAEAAILGVGAPAFNIFVNNGSESGQAVAHWHLHVVPRHSPQEIPLAAGAPADLTKLPFTAAAIRENLKI